jgi:hypothetical protein
MVQLFGKSFSISVILRYFSATNPVKPKIYSEPIPEKNESITKA